MIKELTTALRFTFRVAFLVLRVVLRGAVPVARRTFGLAVAVSPLLVPLLYAPLAGFAFGWMLGGRGFGLLGFVLVLGVDLALMADSGHGFTLDAFDEELRGAVQQSRRRLAALRVRRGWDQTCAALGWDTTAADPRSNGAPKLIRRPALRHVVHLGDRLRVAFRPRGDQGPKEWPALVDALRRHLGMHSADHFEHPGEPGTLCATFGPAPLPTVHRVADDNPVSETVLSARSPSDDLRIVLGPRAGGGDAVWVPSQSPHVLIAGSTGGGKGVLIRVLVRDLLVAGAVVRVMDAKATGEHKWIAESGATVVHDLAGIVEVLRQARDEIATRCARLWQEGLDKMQDLPLEQRLPPLYLVLDEAGDTLMLRKVAAEKERDDLRSEAGALLAIVCSQGRAADVHAVVAIQRPDVGLLGPVGGFLRDQLTGRIGLGRLTEEGLSMLFGSGHSDRLAALTGRPGRGLAVGLAAGETTPYGLQIEHVLASDVRPIEVPVMTMNGGER